MRKIRDSLAAKVFLWVVCALMLCSFFIYGIVMAIIPRQYTALANDRISQEIEQLAHKIDGADYASASTEIYNFCIQNHAVATLSTGDEVAAFGEKENTAGNTYSLSVALHLFESSESSVLTVIASASTAGEITRTFLRMLPLVIGATLLLSFLSAWFCSRLIVTPVLQISSVSKRMAQMDMTWHCETGRTDELGTLARSLNTLSERLTQTMGELEAANRQLRQDIAASRTLEKQRRDFFAAVSHELKTPVTILKGQLESMALGIGDYQNHEKYLPQTLAAVESMEQLIREVLAITKMESGIPESSFTQEALAPILRTCIAELQPFAEEKQIAIDIQQMNEAVSASVNKRLFQKAITNVLSNAVRYSPEGQRMVVTLTGDALTVENTGVTIGEDDLPLLFTPFYRADPSRNRKSGGSGLGLYIVKTILDLHHLACKMENTENAVRFTIFLNQNEIK